MWSFSIDKQIENPRQRFASLPRMSFSFILPERSPGIDWE